MFEQNTIAVLDKTWKQFPWYEGHSVRKCLEFHFSSDRYSKKSGQCKLCKNEKSVDGYYWCGKTCSSAGDKTAEAKKPEKEAKQTGYALFKELRIASD